MTALLAITADEIEDYINRGIPVKKGMRSEEHTSELQSHSDLVCRLLLEKKKKNNYFNYLDNRRRLRIDRHQLRLAHVKRSNNRNPQLQNCSRPLSLASCCGPYYHIHLDA